MRPGTQSGASRYATSGPLPGTRRARGITVSESGRPSQLADLVPDAGPPLPRGGRSVHLLATGGPASPTFRSYRAGGQHVAAVPNANLLAANKTIPRSRLPTSGGAQLDDNTPPPKTPPAPPETRRTETRRTETRRTERRRSRRTSSAQPRRWVISLRRQPNAICWWEAAQLVFGCAASHQQIPYSCRRKEITHRPSASNTPGRSPQRWPGLGSAQGLPPTPENPMPPADPRVERQGAVRQGAQSGCVTVRRAGASRCAERVRHSAQSGVRHSAQRPRRKGTHRPDGRVTGVTDDGPWRRLGRLSEIPYFMVVLG